MQNLFSNGDMASAWSSLQLNQSIHYDLMAAKEMHYDKAIGLAMLPSNPPCDKGVLKRGRCLGRLVWSQSSRLVEDVEMTE